jgi:SAM-dependent methyltransferase
MNAAKAALFDAEAGAPWAAAPYGDTDRPKIARLLAAAELDAGAQALEPGCGTGRLTTVLAVTVRAYRHVAVHHAGVEDFALEPGTFNAIVCHQVVPHFDDLPAALVRLARGLRPGGRLVVVHFIGAERVNAIHQAAANPILHYDRLPAPGEMSELLRAVGLTVDWAVDDELGYLVRARARSEPIGIVG